MRLSWLGVATACGLVGCLLAACGANESSGGSSARQTQMGGTCGSCTTNESCQTGCPAVTAGSINCCEFSTGACVVSTSGSCAPASAVSTGTADAMAAPPAPAPGMRGRRRFDAGP